jgi:cysteinyl-tRNA synthetase
VAGKAEVVRYKKKFLEVLGDDLNTAKALALLWEVLRSKKVNPPAKLDMAGSFDQVMGLNLLLAAKKTKPGPKVPASIMAIARERWDLKMAKKFTDADALRLELAKKGYEVEDGPDNFTIYSQK